MKPILKKTITGYVVKHVCACGESLLSKISEVGMQDYCPACNAAFVVPGKELVLQLKEKKAAEKKLSDEEKRAEKDRRLQQRLLKEELRQQTPPPIDQGPRSPRIQFQHSVDENVLRGLADAAAEWIGILGRLAMGLTILIQIGLICWCVYSNVVRVQVIGFDILDFTVSMFGLCIFSAVLWLTYYLVKVQLGMVAAVVLIERNTRSH